MQRYARNRHVYTLALLPLALSTWATPTFRPTPYSADPATTVLLHLDGDAVNDSPSHATVSAIGTAWSDDGIIGGALTCNGETKLSVMPGTTFARGFSVEAWLRPQRPMGPGKYVLVAHHGSFEAGLDVDPLGRCRPYLHVRTAVGRFAALTYDRLIFTRWAHVAFVYAPGVESGSALALYIHGRKVRSIKRPKEWIAHGDLTPGTGPLVLLTGLVGDVDEIRISDRPRRPEEFVCPWPSGRWGDFEPFRPAVVAQPAPDEWKPERVRFLAIEAVPTFRSISLYTPFAHDANANAECGVRYRVHGTEAWHRGMDLIRSTEEAEFRGSLLQLQPDTTYEIELTARDPDGAGVLPRLIQRTWSETLPIAEERVLSAGDVGEPLTIRARGQPDGWIRYAPPPGESTTIAVGADAPYAVRIEGAAFVVLERVTVRGGTEHGVLVTDSHDIRIRRCEVTGWGVAGTRNAVGLYVAPSGGTINCQDAIHLGLLTRRIVVEDNFIHTPCGTATCWRYGHPVGPQATTLGYNGSRNNVVRNNDIVGSEEHWYNDIIGSTGNGSPFGGPYRDTDIHGNFMSHSQDNAVELDGGQMNVRFWDNRMEYTYRSISFAPCIKGPGYAFFNLVAHPGDEFLRTGTAFKMGRHELNHGLNLIFFNTVVGRSGAGLPNRPEPYATSDRRVYAHNNLSARPGTFHDPSDPWHAPPASGMFVFEDAPRADYRLRPGSAGVDEGAAIAGVDHPMTGTAPDLGAFELGTTLGAVPIRPSGMTVWPQHVALTATAGKTGVDRTAAVTLSFPARAGATWHARPNETWLTCTPAEGTTGTPVQVVLGCDATRLPPRSHRAVMTFRTERGLNRSLTVAVRVRHARPFIRFFEAENVPATGPAAVRTGAGASGAGYVYETPGTAEGSWTFTFNVPAAGDYYVLGRFLTPTGQLGGFMYAMDGDESRRWTNQSKSVQTWVWDLLRPHERKNVRTTARGFQLRPGKHTLVLTTRRSGTWLDCVAISNEPYAPKPEGR